MKMFFALTSLIFCLSAFSQDAVVAVGNAGQDKDKLVVDDAETRSLTGGQKNLSSELTDILRNNFAFYRHKFETIDYADKGKGSYSTPAFDKWKASGITYMIASEHKSGFGDSIETKYKAYSVLTGKEIFNGKFSVGKNDLRQNAHRIADAIYRAITGKPSIFNSKIVFVSDRTSRGKDVQKELYLMDFDGRRVEKLTDFHSVVISPAVAPDNSKIMFSLIASKREISRNKVRTIKNIDLKVYDLVTKRFSTVSERPGINSGAIYTGRGNQVYLTLSFGGNADIYEMDLGTHKMRKVTTHYADDVDPSVTQDGSLMTFLSNRSGRAHIYTMDPAQAEKDVKRISFVGQFNATPRFSPDGKEIVFSSWVYNSFDLYRISSEGNNLSRLTKNFGSNEEPVYSPDGEFIVFTSKKQASRGRATQDIYIMNREGEILGQLTKDFGQCASPVWTNILK